MSKRPLPTRKRKAEDPPKDTFAAASDQDDGFAEYNERAKAAKVAHSHAGRANISEKTLNASAKKRFDDAYEDLVKVRDIAIQKLEKRGAFEPTLPEYNVFFVKNSPDGQDVVAGYLLCPDVATLWRRFIQNKDVCQILQDLYKEDNVRALLA